MVKRCFILFLRTRPSWWLNSINYNFTETIIGNHGSGSVVNHDRKYENGERWFLSEKFSTANIKIILKTF